MMKEFKGTKGKWFPVEYAGHWSIQAGQFYGDTDILDQDVVLTGEAYLNARLCAAAPDLLECLLKLVYAHKSDNTKDYGFWVEMSEKAINKALEK